MQRNWRKQLEREAQRISDETMAAVQAIVGVDNARPGEELARYTSYRIGGPAELFVQVGNEDQLRELLPLLHGANTPVTILGGGSNVLILDGGVRGAVLKLGKGFDWIEPGEREPAEGDAAPVQAADVGAATGIGYLLKTAKQQGWAGLAPVAGTPGTVGGALKMNAGDRRVWLGDFVHTVRVVTKDGAVKEIAREKAGYGYRSSSFPGGSVITAGHFRFAVGDIEQVRGEIEAHIAKRKATQPLNQPSGGSVFRNPEGAHAGELIERAGLKGVRLHQAQISDKHANFIVNLGGARARDVLALIRMAKQKIFEETGIRMEEELRVIGEPGEEDEA